MASEADELWAGVRDAYATCESYRDEGIVTTTSYDQGRKTTKRKPFSTRFVRGVGLLFEYRKRRGEDDWEQYAIWSEGDIARSWWSIRNELEETSLAMALAGATGVSSGVASCVPRLLLPDLYQGAPIDAPRSVESEDAQKAGCFVLSFEFLRHGAEHFWIDRATSLIRRVVEPRHQRREFTKEDIEELRKTHPEAADRFAEFNARNAGKPRSQREQVTVYDAAFNVPIDPDELSYTPPGAAT